MPKAGGRKKATPKKKKVAAKPVVDAGASTGRMTRAARAAALKEVEQGKENQPGCVVWHLCLKSCLSFFVGALLCSIVLLCCWWFCAARSYPFHPTNLYPPSRANLSRTITFHFRGHCLTSESARLFFSSYRSCSGLGLAAILLLAPTACLIFDCASNLQHDAPNLHSIRIPLPPFRIFL